MITILTDQHIEGQAQLLFGSLASEGWLALLPLELKTFAHFGLPLAIDDPTLWRFAQQKRLLLLTATRSLSGPDSLEQIIWDEARPDSLPVLTLTTPSRIDDKAYRERCGQRLLEICCDLDQFLGTGRLYLP